MENVRRFVPEQQQEQKIDLFVYRKIIWRKKYYIIIPVVISLIISVVGIRHLTPLYESSTLVAAENQNVFSGTMRRYIAPVEQSEEARNRQFRAMIETRIMSRPFLELVIRDLGLHRSYDARIAVGGENTAGPQPASEELVIRHLVDVMKSKLRVESTMYGFYRISVLDSDPATAHVLAAKIGDKYIEVNQQAKLQGLRQAGAFSDEQLAIYKEKLEESEKELERIRREMAATDVSANPVNASNVHLAEARNGALEAQVDMSESNLRRVRETLTAVLGMVPSSERIVADNTIVNIERRLIAGAEERALLEFAGSEESVAELAATERLWETLWMRMAEVVAAEYGELSPEVRSLITEYYYQRLQVNLQRRVQRRVAGYIEQYRSNISRRPQLQREENRLLHEVETNRSIYQAFLESKTSAQITEAMQSTDLGVVISVIEPAEMPFAPVKPNAMQIILMALIFGISCGGGSILLTEYMDDSFRSVEEVQRVLKSPVLGTVPRTVSHFAWERRKRGRMILMWIIGLFLFVSLISGAMYIYARSLEGLSIGVELSVDRSGR